MTEPNPVVFFDITLGGMFFASHNLTTGCSMTSTACLRYRVVSTALRETTTIGLCPVPADADADPSPPFIVFAHSSEPANQSKASHSAALRWIRLMSPYV